MAMNYRIYVETSANTFQELPVPSAMSYGLQDISAANAGRTESTLMMKDRLGKAPKIDITYNNRDTNLVTSALAMVAPEYTNIIYMDLESGGVYTYGQFYRGDVSMQVYNGALDIWSTCKFALIKRDGKNGTAVTRYTKTTTGSTTYTVGSSSTVSTILRGGSSPTLGGSGTSRTISPTAGCDCTVIYKNTAGTIVLVDINT